MTWIARIIPLFLMLVSCTTIRAEAGDLLSPSCGSLRNAFGPFDYYDPGNRAQLRNVEDNHFTAGVESLSQRKTGTFGADLAYVLRAFPNHPRALLTMVRLGQKEGSDSPAGAGISVYCYLERAVRFRPADGQARVLLANYWIRNNDTAAAKEQLKVAEEHTNGSGNVHYNLGLAFLSLQMYDKALVHAHEAYRLGFDLPGLRRKLEAAGRWKDATMVVEMNDAQGQ